MNKRLQNKRNAEIAPVGGTNFPAPMRPQQFHGIRKKNSMHLKLVHKAQNGQAVENSVKVGNNLALP